MRSLFHVFDHSFDRGPESQGNSTTRYYAERPNHSAMTRPLKTGTIRITVFVRYHTTDSEH